MRLASGYPLRQVERLIRDLEPLLHLEEQAQITVDLGGLVHMSPAGLALLAAALRRLSHEWLVAPESKVLPPRSQLVHDYLLRMDVIRHGLGMAEVPEDFQRHAAVGFRPCHHFVTEDECHTASRELTAALVERCQTDTVTRGSLWISLDELAENVLHHADSTLGGFAAAQGWPRKRHEMEVAIVDLGRGVRASLTKNPAYADIGEDVSAILKALELNVTATPERNSGLGLTVARFALARNGGSLLVRSGHGAVYSGTLEDAHECEVDFPGTLVGVTARTDQPLDVGAIFRELGYKNDA